MTAAPKGILRSPKYSAKASNIDAPNAAAAPRQVKSLADLVKSSVALNEEVRVSVVDDEQSARVDNLVVAPINEEEDVTSTEDAEESDNEAESDDESVYSEDGEILMMLGLADIVNNDDSDADETDQVVKGSFRKLWETLMQWTTPSTAQHVCQCNNIHQSQNQTESLGQPSSIDNSIDQVQDDHTRNTIDIGASRRAGIMNMIRMNISRSLSDLEPQHDVTDRRKVEKSLANLVNTFDCSGPAVDFDMKLWRGMTTILIAIVSPARINEVADARSSRLPKSVAALGIGPEEYHYLIERALTIKSSAKRNRKQFTTNIQMDGNNFAPVVQQWFRSMPPITRTWFAATVLVTGLVNLSLLDLRYLYLHHWSDIWAPDRSTKIEAWRYVTKLRSNS
ncbi:hypothetical protein ACHAWO_009668 [Cyclotella atomus]|uniref:Uncharacterized protein n=1 Tax=Cyclotella atomus TaxID=382360 RepID=A0ABD3PE54_9STRA